MPPSTCPGQLDPSEESGVSEKLSQDLLGSWRKTRTSRTLQWPGERPGGPESSCDQCRLRSSEPPQARPARLWMWPHRMLLLGNRIMRF